LSAGSSDKGHLVVIGGGPGGYPAAFLAADLGFSVTLIDERPNPGGVCLFVGCIPSKALLHVARLIHESREAAAWGLTFADPKIDLDKLRAWKDEKVVKKLTGGLGSMAKGRKVKFIQGRARFAGSRQVEVATADGKKQLIDFDHAVIATGSRPAIPKTLKVQSDRLMDSSAALELRDVPGSLLVIGGGYIGLEMGTVYAALGSKVTVVEMLSGILPGADRDLADVLHKQLKGQFEAIHTDTRVTEMSAEKDGLSVKLLGMDLKETRKFDKVLVSVGRVPNSQDLGLENTKVKTTERGHIEIDAQRRTADEAIYAIGDVAGEPMLAHKATHEAFVAVRAAAGEPVAWDPACVPAVVFTDPEVAWVGITEVEALNKNIPYKVGKFPWAASGRATTLGRSDGLTKLIVDPRTQRVLGCGIVGISAGDLIAEAALAIEMGATAKDLAATIHPHPTMSESLMEAAEVYLGHSVHFMPRK
jgi:dihydrolipoamide dehydrogenase